MEGSLNIVFLDASTLGSSISLDPIARQGKLTSYPFTHVDEAAQRLANADVAIVNKTKVTKELIDACPNLKLVCVAATGMNNIDLAYAAEKNIVVKNVANYSTDSVAQVTFGLVLGLLNKLCAFDAHVKSGDYSKGLIFTYLGYDHTELAGKCYGIIGMGNIGKRVAQIATAFGCKVLYYSTSGNNSSASEYERVSLEELLKTSDVISIHAPLNEQTKNLIIKPQLQLMKPTAILVNVGRGGIVNELDLLEAIEDSVIAGAGLDVFKKEPIPANHPFLTSKANSKLILLPHIGWASVEARTRLVEKIAENIKNFKIERS